MASTVEAVPKEPRKPSSSHKSRPNGKSGKSHGSSDKKSTGSSSKKPSSGSSSSKTKDKKPSSSQELKPPQEAVMPESQSTVTWVKPAELIFTSTKLGEGSQGVVYSGTFRQQTAALKKLNHQNSADASKFEKEIEALVEARHPNIVLLMCACSVPGNLVIGFEIVPLGNLKKLLEGPEHPTLVEKFKIAHTITLGLNWIHRSHVHGSLSTTKILITSDFTAKICGFGISGPQRGTLPDFADDKYNYWNWRNPEEKETIAHDTYSLGLVFWSLFQPAGAQRLPYKELASYDAFVAAVKRGTRPSIDHIPPIVGEICQTLWAKDPAARPELKSLKLFDLMVDATLPCPTARSVWRAAIQSLNGTEYPTYVPMHIFFEKLYQGTGEEKPLPDVPQYRCLERMFGFPIAATGEATHFVRLERFSQMISWFGPLRGPRTAHMKWIAALENIMAQKWFHSESTKIECDKAIGENHKNKIGSYLVRISTSSAPEAPFTLAKLEQKSVINNLRIYATDQGYYCQSSPSVIDPTLPGLIKKISKSLKLTEGIIYQPFLVLFETTALAGCYGATTPTNTTLDPTSSDP